MNSTKHKKLVLRWFYYIAGMLTLALGITLNTKTGLGVSPIISVPYSISTILNLNFGNMTLAVYCIFVLVEFILKGKNAKLYDILQIPLALVFTRFMNLFSDHLAIPMNSLISRLIYLIIAIILTGVGAAVSLNMHLVPNPGDGIVQAIAEKTGKGTGITKNYFDLLNITITITVSLVFTGKLIGIGLGTVLAVLGVGRVIALFNHFLMKPMERSAF